MIQTLVEWIFVDLVYGSFAAMRARRRRRAFRLGKEVKFPGFVLQGPAVTHAARGYLCAIGALVTDQWVFYRPGRAGR